MIVRLQLSMQNYLMKYLEIFCKQREGKAETFDTNWQIYQESLTIRVKKTCQKLWPSDYPETEKKGGIKLSNSEKHSLKRGS